MYEGWSKPVINYIARFFLRITQKNHFSKVVAQVLIFSTSAFFYHSGSYVILATPRLFLRELDIELPCTQVVLAHQPSIPGASHIHEYHSGAWLRGPLCRKF